MAKKLSRLAFTAGLFAHNSSSKVSGLRTAIGNANIVGSKKKISLVPIRRATDEELQAYNEAQAGTPKGVPRD